MVYEFLDSLMTFLQLLTLTKWCTICFEKLFAQLGTIFPPIIKHHYESVESS
jgi:hypothetical protein